MADKSLNRTDLVSQIAADSNLSQSQVNSVLDSLFSTLATSVGEGTKVTIPGWLAVERTHRAARAGRNPSTGEAIQIAEGYGVKVSAGSKLKAAAK